MLHGEDKLPNEAVKEHDVEHKEIKRDHAVKEHEEHEHDSRETIESQRQQQGCINEDDQDENHEWKEMQDYDGIYKREEMHERNIM